MSKASEFAAAIPKRQELTFSRDTFVGYVTDSGSLSVDGELPIEEVPAFIRWLRETFED